MKDSDTNQFSVNNCPTGCDYVQFDYINP